MVAGGLNPSVPELIGRDQKQEDHEGEVDWWEKARRGDAATSQTTNPIGHSKVKRVGFLIVQPERAKCPELHTRYFWQKRRFTNLVTTYPQKRRNALASKGIRATLSKTLVSKPFCMCFEAIQAHLLG